MACRIHIRSPSLQLPTAKSPQAHLMSTIIKALADPWSLTGGFSPPQGAFQLPPVRSHAIRSASAWFQSKVSRVIFGTLTGQQVDSIWPQKFLRDSLRERHLAAVTEHSSRSHELSRPPAAAAARGFLHPEDASIE